MARTNTSLRSRIALAFHSFFSIVSRPDFAASVERLHAGGQTPSTRPTPSTEAEAAQPAAPLPAAEQGFPDAAALQLLGLLQREARFVDFIREDVASYSDADIGAASRVVHEGCRKVLSEHFDIEPVRSEDEGSRITLAAGFDAAAVRLTGNVVGQPPFVGRLSHRGWRVTASRLPRLAETHDPAILAQAEVEL